jgi:hypothetical protein
VLDVTVNKVLKRTFQNDRKKSGMGTHACDPTILWRLRQEDCEFKDSLGYIPSSRPALVT